MLLDGTLTGPPHAPRWVQLDCAVNARDLGGIPVAGGRRVRTGRLFRSDHLDDCSTRDLAVLRDALGIRTVIDLRHHPRERVDPNRPLPFGTDVDVFNIPMVRDLETFGSALAAPGNKGLSAFYVEMTRLDRRQIVEAVRTLALHCQAPVWLHCTSGKDRTGTVIALVLSLLGASTNDIVADYACTIVDRDAAAAHMKRQGWRPKGFTSAHMRADAVSMQNFLDWFGAEHGTAAEWLVRNGLEPQHLTTLRSELLETDPAA
jgi:protein tyrosine/serine phosphatase